MHFRLKTALLLIMIAGFSVMMTGCPQPGTSGTAGGSNSVLGGFFDSAAPAAPSAAQDPGDSEGPGETLHETPPERPTQTATGEPHIRPRVLAPTVLHRHLGDPEEEAPQDGDSEDDPQRRMQVRLPAELRGGPLQQADPDASEEDADNPPPVIPLNPAFRDGKPLNQRPPVMLPKGNLGGLR